MLRKPLRYLYSLRSMARVNMALSRGLAARSTRNIDLTEPRTWEFSGFSQNGEDGILEVLCQQLHKSNRYFLEIGASDGLENNTSWLAMVRRFGGVWVEGSTTHARHARELFIPLNYGLQVVPSFVTADNVGQIVKQMLHRDPDVLSLDIDGNDYYIACALLEARIHPKICVVEYNSAYGPEQPLTVPYTSDFHVRQRFGDSLYYGCSIAAWRKLFDRFGYRFVTVEQNGVNAFFVDPDQMDVNFLDAIRGTHYLESFSHAREYHRGWQDQFSLIADRPLFEV